MQAQVDEPGVNVLAAAALDAAAAALASPRADLPLRAEAALLASDAGEAAPSGALQWLCRSLGGVVHSGASGSQQAAAAASAAAAAAASLRGVRKSLAAQGQPSEPGTVPTGVAPAGELLLQAFSVVAALLSPPEPPLSSALELPLPPASEAAIEAFAAAAEPRLTLLVQLAELIPPSLLLPAEPERTPDGVFAAGCATASALPSALVAVAALRTGWGGESPAGGAPPWSPAAAAAAAAVAVAALSAAFAAASGRSHAGGSAAPGAAGPQRQKAEQDAMLFALASQAPRLRDILAASASPSGHLRAADALRAAQALRAAVCSLRHPAASDAADVAVPAILCALDHFSPLVQVQAHQAVRHLAAEATRTALRRWAGPLLDALLKAVVAPEASLVAVATASATAVTLQVSSATDPSADPYHRLLPALISGVSWRRTEPERTGPFLKALKPLLRAVGAEGLRYSKSLLELLVEWLGSADTETAIRAAEALEELLKATPERVPAHARSAWPALSAAFVAASESNAPRRAAEARAAMLRCVRELAARGGFGFGLAWRAQERSWAAAAGGESARHATALFAALRVRGRARIPLEAISKSIKSSNCGHSARVFVSRELSRFFLPSYFMQEAAQAAGEPPDESSFRQKHASQLEVWRAAASAPASDLDGPAAPIVKGPAGCRGPAVGPAGVVKAALRRRLEALSQLPWEEQDEVEGQKGWEEETDCALHGRSGADEAARAEALRRSEAASAQHSAKRTAEDSAGPGALAREQAEVAWRAKAIAVTSSLSKSEPARGCAQGRWWVGNPEGTQPALRAAEAQVRIWDAASKDARSAADAAARGGASVDSGNASERWVQALAQAEAAEEADAAKRSRARPGDSTPAAAAAEGSARLARARKADEQQRVRVPSARTPLVSVEQLVMGAISVQMTATSADRSDRSSSEPPAQDWGLLEGRAKDLSLPVLAATDGDGDEDGDRGLTHTRGTADARRAPPLLLAPGATAADGTGELTDGGELPDIAGAELEREPEDQGPPGYPGYNDDGSSGSANDSYGEDTSALVEGSGPSFEQGSSGDGGNGTNSAQHARGPRGAASAGPGGSPWELIEKLLLAEEEARDAAGGGGGAAADGASASAHARPFGQADGSAGPNWRSEGGGGALDEDTLAAVRHALAADDSLSVFDPPLPFVSRPGASPRSRRVSPIDVLRLDSTAPLGQH